MYFVFDVKCVSEGFNNDVVGGVGYEMMFFGGCLIVRSL